MSERDARIADIRRHIDLPDSKDITYLLDQLAAQDAEIAILRDPVKWMQWCDHRVLERCEAAEAKIATLTKERDLWRREAKVQAGDLSEP